MKKITKDKLLLYKSFFAKGSRKDLSLFPEMLIESIVFPVRERQCLCRRKTTREKLFGFDFCIDIFKL